ncbi:LTA synthase family protein [Clostridiaceae bacterium]|nr:LTA synthase family protein [Clostridiaceae bacterium]RKI11105.1 LTA synthase family protein [bacterium 1XD21-70]
MKRLWRLLGCLALAALAVNVTIEFASRKSLPAVAGYLFGSPLVFLVNTLLVLAPFLPVFFVRRKFFAAAVAAFLWIAAGVANGVLLMFRTTPFTATDFRLVKYAASLLTTYLTWPQISIGGAAAAAVLAICVAVWRKVPADPQPVNLTQSACVAAVGMAVIWGSLNLAMLSGLVAVRFGNIGQAYEAYGFPYCFANSLFNTGIARPDEYSREVVAEVEAEALKPEKLYSLESNKTPNVIMVQLESFFDPTLWLKNPVEKDPIPFFRYLVRDYPSGYLNVPSVGAGTANTEFECITGMNLDFFGPGEYPYKTVLQKRVCESMAYTMRGLGYRAHAIHNNEATFYDRHKVFAQLGFETFTPIEYMYRTEKNPTGWCRDEVLVDEVFKALDSSVGQDFIYAISVQGHGKYPSFEYYCEQIRDMDRFVKKLVYQLARRREPTVLVLYGDHLPGFEWSQEEMANRSLYQTQYVVWNNMGLPDVKIDLEAYQLTAHILNLLNIHEGTMPRFHQHYMKKSVMEKEEYLEAMELLEYDILYGGQEVYGGESPFEAAKMEMGTVPIIQKESACYAGRIVVYGENFNEYSVVCVDGKPVETVFVGQDCLTGDGGTWEEGKKITVQQIGRDKVPLGTARQMFEP